MAGLTRMSSGILAATTAASNQGVTVLPWDAKIAAAYISGLTTTTSGAGSVGLGTVTAPTSMLTATIGTTSIGSLSDYTASLSTTGLSTITKGTALAMMCDGLATTGGSCIMTVLLRPVDNA
jgi:hypothetical protein